jgi:transposase-like protein
VAGSPKRRARREAASRVVAPGVRAGVTDPASRAAAVDRAGRVGAGVVAAELGVSPATIRSWRRRLKEAGGVPVLAPGKAPVVPAPPAVRVEGGAVAQLEETAAQARQIVADAAARTRQLTALGHDVGARESAATAKLWSGTLRDVEAALATALASGARLSDARVEQIAELIRECMGGLELPMGVAVRGLWRELLTTAGEGKEVLGERMKGAAAARAEVWGPVRERVREELRLEVREEVARELQAAADAVRADEAVSASVEVLGEPVGGLDGEGDGEVVDGVLVGAGGEYESEGDGARRVAAVAPMGIPKGGPRGGGYSLAERLAGGGR